MFIQGTGERNLKLSLRGKVRNFVSSLILNQIKHLITNKSWEPTNRFRTRNVQGTSAKRNGSLW